MGQDDGLGLEAKHKPDADDNGSDDGDDATATKPPQDKCLADTDENEPHSSGEPLLLWSSSLD